jgi:hypothetical protein
VSTRFWRRGHGVARFWRSGRGMAAKCGTERNGGTGRSGADAQCVETVTSEVSGVSIGGGYVAW